MNDDGKLNLKLMRELFNKLQDIFLLFAIVKLDCPCQPVKKLHINIVV
jgi:hypothetical protein